MAIIGVGYFYVRHNSYCEPYGNAGFLASNVRIYSFEVSANGCSFIHHLILCLSGCLTSSYAVYCVCGCTVVCSVYSLFALCEWSVVYSNIYYHWLVSWDFAGYHLMLAPGVPSSFQPLSVLNHSSSYSNSGSGRLEAGDYDRDRTDEFDTPAKLL